LCVLNSTHGDLIAHNASCSALFFSKYDGSHIFFAFFLSVVWSERQQSKIASFNASSSSLGITTPILWSTTALYKEVPGSAVTKASPPDDKIPVSLDGNIKSAAYVSTISGGMKAKVQKKVKKDIIMFPNWVDTQKLFPLKNRATLLGFAGMVGKTTIQNCFF